MKFMFCMCTHSWYTVIIFPRFKFKALELNRKILEGALAPKKPVPKEATRPVGFQLEVEKRLQERHTTIKTVEQDDYTFHSRPLPTRILEEVVVRSIYSNCLEHQAFFSPNELVCSAFPELAV